MIIRIISTAISSGWICSIRIWTIYRSLSIMYPKFGRSLNYFWLEIFLYILVASCWCTSMYIYINWLVVSTPLKNTNQWEGWHPIYEMESHEIHVPNHQTHTYIYTYINTFIEPFPASQAWHGRLPRVLEALDTLIHSSLLPVILRREKSWISFINKYLLYIIVIYLTFNNILVYRYMYTIILWWNVYIYIYECISYIHIYIG